MEHIPELLQISLREHRCFRTRSATRYSGFHPSREERVPLLLHPWNRTEGDHPPFSLLRTQPVPSPRPNLFRFRKKYRVESRRSVDPTWTRWLGRRHPTLSVNTSRAKTVDCGTIVQGLVYLSPVLTTVYPWNHPGLKDQLMYSSQQDGVE
jgi:hypothetical protein